MKKFEHIVKVCILIFSILSINLPAWGAYDRSYRAGVGVGSGKGTAKVEMKWQYIVESTVDDATSSGAVEYVSTSQSKALKTSLVSYKCIYSVVSAGTGYSFAGWYSNSSCSGKAASTSSTWTAKNYTTDSWDVTYYAKFTPNTYTVIFNGNGGSSPSSQKVTYDATYGDLPSSTRSGYTFAGWYTAATGGSQVTASTKVQTANDHTLYAQWTANSYDVTLKAHGGVGADQVVSAKYNSKMPTKLKNGGDIVAPTKTGYSFTGYFKGDAQYYDNNLTPTNTKWTTVGNGTLLAGWQANTYTVSFNGNGGSNADNKTVTYDATYGELPSSTRTGYTFVGWFTEAAGGTQVTSSTTVKITAAQMLYAHWTAKGYTIDLNNQSATTAGTTSLSVVYDSNANLTGAITLPTKTNCTFEGYFTAVKGGGSQLIGKDGKVIAGVSGYTDGSKNWKCANNVTLYAYWKGNQEIVWDLEENIEYATGTLMGATATSGLAITYTSDHPEWGYINEAGRLVVVEPNKTITITASQAGNVDWNKADKVEKKFITLGAHPDQFTDVHATNITYGDLLSASTLSGKVYFQDVEISGTLEWVDPSLMPNAGTADQMVLFTPDNSSAYSSVYFVVPVTVEKANPTFRWNISNVLREDVRYSRFVESSNKEVGLTYSTNSSLLSITDGVLTTGEVENKQTELKIIVSQAESANYKAKTETLTIAIYPKAKICLPIDLRPSNTNASEDFADANVAQVGSVNWCNTNDNGSEPFDSWGWGLINVTYSQRVGIKLGNWRGGFDYSTKYVDLFFSGIPDQISFDYELQTVHSPGIDWPTTSIDWYLYESADDVTYTERVHRTNNSGTITYTLDENTRYVRIVYGGNFAGFIKNLRITRKQYIRTDKSTMTFGTKDYPLQEPQPLKISYSSLGVCGGSDEDAITITSTDSAFYVDKTAITEGVGVEQKGEYTIYVRCNDVNQTGALHIESNDGTVKNVQLESKKPNITTAATFIFETGTEHAPVAETTYRAKRTHDFSACFDGAKALYDTLYIYGVTESSATERLWAYDAHKGYYVPAINVKEGNVHTPCFVYTKNDTQYDYVRTFDAATTTLNIEASNKKLGFVGYKPASLATTIAANQINGANVELYLDNTEMVASGNVFALSGTATIRANKSNILMATNGAAVKLSDAPSQLTIEDTWQSDEASGLIALRPQAGSPSIDLGSASGKVTINGAQVELHNGSHLAIAHLNGNTEKYDGEVYINDGTIGGEVELGLPKMTRIDGGTFNDGTVLAYTVKGFGKRPRNSRGDMLSRHTMSPEALADNYSWYGHAHLTTDDLAKVHPMLMDEQVCIFEGTVDEDSHNESNWTKWPAADDDVLINAPMIITGAEMKVKSLTINWVRGEHGQPAVTVAPDGGLTVGEGGIDGAVKDNLLLKAGQEGETKGQTGFLRIHPNSAELMPEAMVKLFSTAYYDMTIADHNETGEWQFVGYPMRDGAAAMTVFNKSFLYEWNTTTSDWENNRKSCVLKPFQGYATSQYRDREGWLITFAGELVENEDKEIDLAYNEGSEYTHNMLANSYSAPIDIANFVDEDFNGMQAAVYIFNTGSREDIKKLGEVRSGSCNIAGQYLTIPIGSASNMKSAFSTPTVIAPMQGFCVHATEKGAQLRLHYNSLVWNAANENTPLHAPNSNKEEQVGSLCVSLYGEGVADNLYMLESDQYDVAFENGYDAKKMNSGEANIYSIVDEDQLAVNATNNFIGTQIGVRTGDTTAYVMTFTHLNSERMLALIDKETNEQIDIFEGTEYTFFAVPNSEINDRFLIVASATAPEITTGIEETNNGIKAYKFIQNGQLFILKNGMLYTASGALVR